VAHTEAPPQPSETDEVDVERSPTTRLRVLTGAIAVALVVAAGVIVTQHRPPTRTLPRFCAAVASSRGLGQVLANGDADQIEQAVHQLDRVAATAPAAIERQAHVLATYADGLAAAVRKGGDPESALAAAVRAQEGQIAAVDAAGQAVSAFAGQNCGVTLSSGVSPTTGG
jgi:hypothetical protein